MTLNPNASYWTLFCPKYWADRRAGSSTNSRGSSASRWRRNMATSSGSPSGQLRCIAPEPLQLVERARLRVKQVDHKVHEVQQYPCLLYTSDAADERSSVDLG